MPVFSDQLTRGRGKFRCRAVIEGWPYIPVDHRSLARTLSDGRQQIVGLDPISVRFSARADLARAELIAQEMTLELADTAPDYLMTRAFHRAPTATTWLTADLSTSATTVQVANTDAFASSGVIHIGTEAIRYSGKTSTSFTGCTRGYWDSTAQAHTIGSGDRAWYPPVTNLPRALTGRRVRFYLYGSADSATSNGTLRWRSVARSDVDFEEGVYKIPIDPITRVLEQQLGLDVEEAVPLRGIYLPSQSALTIFLRLSGNSSYPNPGTEINSGTIMLSGYYDNNAALCDAINTKIASVTAGWGWSAGSSLRAEVTEDGYELVYTTGATANYLAVGGGEIRFVPGPVPRIPVEVGFSPVDVCPTALPGTTGVQWQDADGNTIIFGTTGGTAMSASTIYSIPISAPVPRTTMARLEHGDRVPFLDTEDTGNPRGRLYLGGTVVPTTGSLVVVRPDGHESDSGDSWNQIYGVDTTERYIDASLFVGTGNMGFLGPDCRIKMIRKLAQGDVGDLIDALIADSPGLVNYGGMPLLTSADISTDYTELRQAIAENALGADRFFAAAEGISLGELLAEELKLVGCYLALDATGKMAIKRLRLATSTSIASVTLDATKIKGSFPRTSRSPGGMLASVLIKQGFDFASGEHKGLPIRVRNTTAATPDGGMLEIAPRSRAGSEIYSDRVEVDPEHALALASAVIGIFGGPYEVTTLGVGLEALDVGIGSTALITSALLPDSDGTMGVSERTSLVVGVDWSPYEGQGTLSLHVDDRRIAGYAPAAVLTSASNLSGNQWVISISIADYTSGEASDWFAPGDEIRIIERNTKTPTRVSGTVVSVTDGAVPILVVNLDGAWGGYASGTGEWRIGYDRAPSVDTSAPAGRRWAQTAFCFVADATGRIGFASGDVDAQELSP